MAKRRADLVQILKGLTSWLGGRATLLTDEMIKAFVKFGVPIGATVYVAQVGGLKLDLMHILAALAALAGPGH